MQSCNMGYYEFKITLIMFYLNSTFHALKVLHVVQFSYKSDLKFKGTVIVA